jgi:uncharacterized protein (TIGR02145 family)/prepilin-type N-terminal cleavage/methylation domain-containing protein
MIKARKKAFTIIELLVVIAIIGVMASIAIIAIQNSRQNAREAKRVADVKQMQTALELYFNEVGEYPASSSVTSSIYYGDNIYMASLPQSPTPNDGDCSLEENQYVYSEEGEENNSYSIAFCLGKSSGDLLAGLKEARPSGIFNVVREEPVPVFNCGVDVVEYEGVTYPTVPINGLCWMTKNLNVGTRIDTAVAQSNNSVLEKYCHSNSVANCDVYGGLYRWDEAVQYETGGNVQGICPAGWYIPSDFIFSDLSNFLGGNSVSGAKLKQVGLAYWASPNLSATDEVGFTALPGGITIASGVSSNRMFRGYFYSSTQADVSYAWSWWMDYNSTAITRAYSIKTQSSSVRCVKDL